MGKFLGWEEAGLSLENELLFCGKRSWMRRAAVRCMGVLALGVVALGVYGGCVYGYAAKKFPVGARYEVLVADYQREILISKTRAPEKLRPQVSKVVSYLHSELAVAVDPSYEETLKGFYEEKNELMLRLSKVYQEWKVADQNWKEKYMQKATQEEEGDTGEVKAETLLEAVREKLDDTRPYRSSEIQIQATEMQIMSLNERICGLENKAMASLRWGYAQKLFWDDADRIGVYAVFFALGMMGIVGYQRRCFRQRAEKPSFVCAGRCVHKYCVSKGPLKYYLSIRGDDGKIYRVRTFFFYYKKMEINAQILLVSFEKGGVIDKAIAKKAWKKKSAARQAQKNLFVPEGADEPAWGDSWETISGEDWVDIKFALSP